MYYTILFYLIIVLLVLFSKNREKALQSVCLLAAVYIGIRYNYPRDYESYQAFFERVASNSYSYDPSDHMEYGWYLITRLFSPLGFYVFVAFCSGLFAFSIFKMIQPYKSYGCILIICLGIFSSGNFITLLSAQRQLFATAIFYIAYRYLLQNNITSTKRYFNSRIIVFLIIIYFLSFFHRSALFLMVVPFFYLMPRRSILVVVSLVVVTVGVLLFGNFFLFDMFESFVDETNLYEGLYLGEEKGFLSAMQSAMYIFQFIFVIYVYLAKENTKDEVFMLLMSLISVVIVFVGLYLNQVGRLALYLFIFTFISIPIIASKLSNRKVRNAYLSINTIWVVWNVYKVIIFQTNSDFSYDIIFNHL